MNKSGNHHFTATIIALVSTGIAGGAALAGGFLDVRFAEATWNNNPLVIDNPYWPLRPDASGIPRTFTYVGETDDECIIDRISMDDINYGGTYALTGAAPYGGLDAVQVVDTEWVFEDLPDGVECSPDLLESAAADDALQELTLDWYRQDDQQNVWYLGEASRDFGDPCPGLDEVPLGGDLGEFEEECTAGSWEAGIDGDPDPEEELIGQAGLVVPGDEPIPGEPLTPGTYYMQEVAYEAEDMAKILKLNASVDDAYPGTDYEDCRKVKEWTALEPGASVEHKWYCAGPGLVLIEGIGGGPTEVEALLEIDPALP